MINFFENEKKSKFSAGLSLDIAYQHECNVCPLMGIKTNKTHKMKPSGCIDNPQILILGEAPGGLEDDQGEQFVGKSGRLLRTNLSGQLGRKYMKRVAFDNVLACRPPDNRTPTDYEMACCRKRLESNIVQLRPKIVAGFGAVPLRVMLGVDRAFEWRGRKIPVKIQDHTFWFMPHIHPAFMLRRIGSSDEETSSNSETFSKENYMDLLTWQRDMSAMIDVLESEPRVVDPSEYYAGIEIIDGRNPNYDLERIRESFKYFKKRRRIFIDFETDGEPNGLRPQNENFIVLSVSISDGRRTTVFPIEHPLAWSGKSKYHKLVWEELRELIEKVPEKGAHNNKFECSVIVARLGEKTVYKGTWIDTEAKAYAMDERSSKKKSVGGGVLSLGRQTQIWFGFNVKFLSKVDRKHLLDAPLDELLSYNGLDAKWEALLDQKMNEELSDDLQFIYKHECNLGRTLALVEQQGVPVSVKAAKRIGRKLDREAEEIRERIESLKEVKQYEKKYRTKFLQPKGKYDIGISNDRIGKLLEKILKLEAVKSTRGGKFSTDKEALDVFAAQGVELANLIVEARAIEKNKTTYVDSTIALTYPDGRIRPNFNHLFVKTGRLSCDDPNIQNYPNKKHNKFIRGMIRAPEGFWLLTYDYAQIEPRMVAACSRDEWMCNAMWEKWDIHGYWTKVVGKRLGIDIEDEEAYTAFRKKIKNKWTLPLIYGSSEESAERDLGARKGQLKREFERYWEELSGVREWQEYVMSFYREHGYVESPIGRRRRGPLSMNDQLNNMIQGVASDVVTDAMTRLSRLAFKLEKPQYRPLWNIHDDLGFLIPDETLEEDMEVIAEQMCMSPFEFINVPLGIEGAVGKSWDKMEEVIKYDSTDFGMRRN